MPIKEQFSSRWGLILASLGMAIGAGNLWRFPRLAGQYGGTFIILWILFLLIWSIPILLAEFSIGKRYRLGVIGSFASAAGKKYTWMGFFIAGCTLCITFYYSVVTAWAMNYLGFSIENAYHALTGGTTISQKLVEDPEFLKAHWTGISSSSMTTVVLHVVAVIIGAVFLYRGIQNGLEKVNKVLIPLLFGFLILISVLSLNVGNGIKGFEYMFTIRPELFNDPAVWLEALTQSAWSTGAGWGLMMTISSYSRDNEDVSLNIFISGFGNNTASLVSGMAILPAVFALAPSEAAAVSHLQAGNQALTFTIIPKLFAEIPGGAYLAVFFFAAFLIAAFSSLLPMIELFIKLMGDIGLSRHASAIRAAFFCILFGFPSAYSLDFFSNQDWVWGIGLVVSGMLIIFAALKYGLTKFKRELIDTDSQFSVSSIYFKVCMIINIFLGMTLIWWWMSRGYDEFPWFDAEGNWNVLSVYSNATIITQWGALLALGFFLNKFLYKKFKEENQKALNPEAKEAENVASLSE
ncbi:sodium-dependent transporter [Rapidithrix thailandica]|uniref:Sodium-dependent transporter n=1 Tax=Rapidithrix thailandica TaxID=413964 RepID=A0AAW9S127_9BACT